MQHTQNNKTYTLKPQQSGWIKVFVDNKMLANVICEKEARQVVYNHIKYRYDNEEIEVLKFGMTKPYFLTEGDFKDA